MRQKSEGLQERNLALYEEEMDRRPKISTLINSFANYKTIPEHTQEEKERESQTLVSRENLIPFHLIAVHVKVD